jgi:hypothetical protein
MSASLSSSHSSLHQHQHHTGSARDAFLNHISGSLSSSQSTNQHQTQTQTQYTSGNVKAPDTHSIMSANMASGTRDKNIRTHMHACLHKHQSTTYSSPLRCTRPSFHTTCIHTSIRTYAGQGAGVSTTWGGMGSVQGVQAHMQGATSGLASSSVGHMAGNMAGGGMRHDNVGVGSLSVSVSSSSSVPSAPHQPVYQARGMDVALSSNGSTPRGGWSVHSSTQIPASENMNSHQATTGVHDHAAHSNSNTVTNNHRNTLAGSRSTSRPTSPVDHETVTHMSARTSTSSVPVARPAGLSSSSAGPFPRIESGQTAMTRSDSGMTTSYHGASSSHSHIPATISAEYVPTRTRSAESVLTATGSGMSGLLGQVTDAHVSSGGHGVYDNTQTGAVGHRHHETAQVLIILLPGFVCACMCTTRLQVCVTIDVFCSCFIF